MADNLPNLHEALHRIAESPDAGAWDALLAHSGTDILRTARRILGEVQLAEDACQETLLQIRAHAGKFKAPHSAPAAHLAARVWIMRIAANVSLQILRARNRAARRDQLQMDRESSIDAALPELKAVKQEEAELLRRAVAELPEKLREPVVLKYFSELNDTELAGALSCTRDAARMRVQRGLERLRTRLAVFGLALTLGDLSANLSGATIHAAGAGAALTAAQKSAWTALLQSPVAPALTNALPAAGMTALGKLGLSAAALILVAGGSVSLIYHAPTAPNAAASAAVKPIPVSVAPPSKPQIQKPPSFPTISVRATEHDPYELLFNLREKGVLVTFLGKPAVFPIVPAALRFHDVDYWTFVEALAERSGHRIEWLRDGHVAILHRGAPDEELARLTSALTANDAAGRLDAVWRAGFVNDVRVIPLLIKGAKDSDADIARVALKGLRRMEWSAVLAYDESALGYVVADLNDPRKYADDLRIENVARGIASLKEETALPLLDILLTKKGGDNLSHYASPRIKHLHTPRGLAFLEKALNMQTFEDKALEGLANFGGERAFSVIEAWLVKSNRPGAHRLAAEAFANTSDTRAIPLLEGWLHEPLELPIKPDEDPDSNTGNEVREYAAHNRCSAALDPGRVRLRELLASSDPFHRRGALWALEGAHDDQARAWVEAAFTDPDEQSQCMAAVIAATMGGERVATQLKGLLNDRKALVRGYALEALGILGGAAAFEELERHAADPDPDLRQMLMVALTQVDDARAIPLRQKLAGNFNDDEASSSVGSFSVGRDSGYDSLSRSARYVRFVNQGVAALPELERAIRTGEKKQMRDAALALSNLDGPRAVELLEEFALDYWRSKDSDVPALLAELGDARSISILQRALASAEPREREKAVGWARKIAGKERAFALIQPLGLDADEKVRAEFYSQVASIVRDVPKLSEPGFAVLQTGLSDAGEIGRLKAADALGSIKTPAARELLRQAIRSPDLSIRKGAAQTLSGVHDGIEAELFPLALADPQEDVRLAALRSLKSQKARLALPLLEHALADPNPRIRVEALNTLGRGDGFLHELGRDPIVEKAARLSSDGDAGVRRAAAEMLGNLAIREDDDDNRAIMPTPKLNERLLPPLLKLLGDESETVREKAVWSLAAYELRTEAIANVLMKRLEIEPSRKLQVQIARRLREDFHGYAGVKEAAAKFPEDVPPEPNRKPPTEDAKF